jgi:branched-chain amino acid transport system substrate-binding protein
MSRIPPFFLVCALFLSACGAAPYTCTDPLGCLDIPPGNPIVIGVLAALNGESAPAGTEMLAAVQSALEETSFILGHEVELVWEGTDCTEENARLATARLVQTPNLLAVIGPSCPADAPFAIPTLEDAGIAVLSPIRGGDAAFWQLAEAIQQSAVPRKDGSLIISRSALQDTIKYLP